MHRVRVATRAGFILPYSSDNTGRNTEFVLSLSVEGGERAKSGFLLLSYFSLILPTSFSLSVFDPPEIGKNLVAISPLDVPTVFFREYRKKPGVCLSLSFEGG